MYCTGGIRCEKASAYFKHHGFKNVFQLEGGVIEYTRQVKAENLESKFIGKNFVFDHRLGERITCDVISNCHQCGKPCDNHTNCANDGCHLLFIQCKSCKQIMENCCSVECQEIIHLPLAEQIKIRKGIQVGNKIFKKGKSENLLFKKSINNTILNNTLLSDIEVVESNIRQKIKTQKVLIGKATHFYTKAQVALFLIENHEVTIGDKIVIKGATTGLEELVLENIFVNGIEQKNAKQGDSITFRVPFRVRKSDKLYKIIH